MTDPSVADLVRVLEGLTDRQRLDFMRWAATQKDPPMATAEWGVAYLERSAAEEAAERAFAVLHNDGTAALSWEFMFDPCFPDTGWDALRAATVMTRAMARSLAAGDLDALAQLATAFERLTADGPEPHSATALSR